MASYEEPGVYINEIPALPTIEGVPTDIAAFVGITETGPENTPTLVTSWNDFTQTFGGFLWNAYLPFAVYAFFQEGGSICYIVKTSLNGQSTADPASDDTIEGNKIFAATPGEWGQKIGYTISNGSSGHTGGANTESTILNFNVTVPKVTVDTIGEKITNSPDSVTVADRALYSFVQYNKLALTTDGLNYILESYSGLTAKSFQTTSGTNSSSPFSQKINANSMFLRVEASEGNDGTTRPSNGTQELSGGGVVNYEFSTAYETLDKIQNISLLGMPDTVFLEANSGAPDLNTMQNTVNETLTYCEGLQSIFYVIDPPLGQDTTEIMEFKSGGGSYGSAINSSYGALYYPWIWFVNPILNLSVLVPPSGSVLGRYAIAPPYQSPAGTVYGQITFASDIEQNVSENDQGILNPAGINAIRDFPNYGILIWGARTVSADNAWQYVSVRRLLIYIEQSLKQGLQWVVFEPNNSKLWGEVQRQVTSFLTGLWQEGALFGSTASDAFFVTCDASNNPPEIIQQGYLNITVGVAAVHPAEFIIINISLLTLTE